FSDRVGAVYEAKTSTALEQALVDLPGSALPGLRPPLPASAGAKPTTRRRAAVKRVWSIFSTSHPHGRWRVDEDLVAGVVFGNAHIDLRQAEVLTDHVDITAVAIFGNIHITVPEG